MKAELERRIGVARQVWTIFQNRPGIWIHWRRFYQLAPLAWRTRISDARRFAETAGGRIEWNESITRSAYRYLPYQPLGRDAAERVTQKSLF